MKSGVTLIGMPGAGKSTVGIILAKQLSFTFIDTDIVIQTRRGKLLQEIIHESGYLALRKIEEEEILTLHADKCVIATGGSAVYSNKAMTHLQQESYIVFLKAGFEEIQKRIRNFDTRGIAKAEHQTFRELFDERQVLYNRYADATVDSSGMTQEELAAVIASRYLSGAFARK